MSSGPAIRQTAPDETTSTLLDLAHVATPPELAAELAALSGLQATAVVKIRPERLALHAVLARLPEGTDGRESFEGFWRNTIAPKLPALAEDYLALDRLIIAAVHDELRAGLFERPGSSRRGSTSGMLGRLVLGLKRTTPPAFQGDQVAEDKKVIARWQTRLETESDPDEQVILQTLLAMVSDIRLAQGRIKGDIATLTALAANRAANILGGRLIGERIDEILAAAAPPALNDACWPEILSPGAAGHGLAEAEVALIKQKRDARSQGSGDGPGAGPDPFA